MKKVKTPVLRFPQFHDEWKRIKLGDVYKERSENGNDDLEILSVSIHHGVSNGKLDEDTLGKHIKRSDDKSLYKHVYSGDLVFNMMRAWQGAIGVAKNEGMISPAYISAIPNNQVYPKFMDYCLRRKSVIDQINNLSYGVTDFRKRLYWKSFIKVYVYLPSIEEQKRITQFLEKIDKLISTNENELKRLKEFKKGMLQKMFPKKGKKVPEIRFPGFTDDWEQRKLGDLGSVSMCKRIFKDQTQVDGEIPFYKIGTFGGEADAYISKKLFDEYKKIS